MHGWRRSNNPLNSKPIDYCSDLVLVFHNVTASCMLRTSLRLFGRSVRNQYSDMDLRCFWNLKFRLFGALDPVDHQEELRCRASDLDTYSPKGRGASRAVHWDAYSSWDVASKFPRVFRASQLELQGRMSLRLLRKHEPLLHIHSLVCFEKRSHLTNVKKYLRPASNCLHSSHVEVGMTVKALNEYAWASRSWTIVLVQHIGHDPTMLHTVLLLDTSTIRWCHFLRLVWYYFSPALSLFSPFSVIQNNQIHTNNQNSSHELQYALQFSHCPSSPISRITRRREPSLNPGLYPGWPVHPHCPPRDFHFRSHKRWLSIHPAAYYPSSISYLDYRALY